MGEEQGVKKKKKKGKRNYVLLWLFSLSFIFFYYFPMHILIYDLVTLILLSITD